MDTKETKEAQKLAKKLDKGWTYSFEVIGSVNDTDPYRDRTQRILKVLKRKDDISLEELVKEGEIAPWGVEYLVCAHEGDKVYGAIPGKQYFKWFKSVEDFMENAGITDPHDVLVSVSYNANNHTLSKRFYERNMFLKGWND